MPIESIVRTDLHRYSAKQNLHHATFFCTAPEAQHVALAGDFSDWNPTPMLRMPDGRWMASLELPHGYHQYVFLVDDQPVLDPNASGTARNERNELVSLIALS
jgi:1,4-alpha-glucan branching enzyme